MTRPTIYRKLVFISPEDHDRFEAYVDAEVAVRADCDAYTMAMDLFCEGDGERASEGEAWYEDDDRI